MDIANMVLFLCSEKAGFITGENICIDGGMTKQIHQMHGGEKRWRIRKMWQPTKYQCLRGGKIYRVPPGTVKKQLPKGQTVTIPVFSARFYHV